MFSFFVFLFFVCSFFSAFWEILRTADGQVDASMPCCASNCARCLCRQFCSLAESNGVQSCKNCLKSPNGYASLFRLQVIAISFKRISVSRAQNRCSGWIVGPDSTAALLNVQYVSLMSPRMRVVFFKHIMCITLLRFITLKPMTSAGVQLMVVIL